jgi:protein-disulfide isomerase
MMTTLKPHMLIGAGLLTLGLALGGCSKKAEEPTGQTAKVDAPIVPAPEGGWVSQVTLTPEGGYLMGNPKAPVHLIEYASLACSHCADFHKDAVTPLKASYIANGQVKYEFRTFILNWADMGVSLVARCGGDGQRFFKMADAFFKDQETWLGQASKLSPDIQNQAQSMPQETQIRFLAEQAGIDVFVRRLGVTKAQFEQCTGDAAGINKLVEMRNTGFKQFNVEGTPTIILNGKKFEDAPTWQNVETAIRALLS